MEDLMVKGLYINNNNRCIENATQEAGELKLLAKSNGVEIMEQYIQRDKKFYVYPGDSSELLEYFHVLSGTVLLEDDHTKLEQGDYFYVCKLQHPVYFTAVTDVKLLYVSNEPLFNYLSSAINQLTGIITQVENKDLYTKNHCKRVQDYSGKIANKLGLDRESLENLNFASLFHDVGKIDIPLEILNKPGRLTNNEFQKIKEHPLKAKELIKDTYYENIGKIIEQHHERLDGSGYPYGLKGNDIVLEAKIIAVVDTFDAMTTDRPYRKAFTPEIAVDELIKLSQIHYDKVIVNVFVEILREEGIIN